MSGTGNNFCRNPNADKHTEIWCLTTDPNTHWENCDPIVGSGIYWTNTNYGLLVLPDTSTEVITIYFYLNVIAEGGASFLYPNMLTIKIDCGSNRILEYVDNLLPSELIQTYDALPPGDTGEIDFVFTPPSSSGTCEVIETKKLDCDQLLPSDVACQFSFDVA